jgi:hypothetical protein
MRPYVGMLLMISTTKIGRDTRKNHIGIVVFCDADEGYIETKDTMRPKFSRTYKGPMLPLPQYDTVIIPVLE